MIAGSPCSVNRPRGWRGGLRLGRSARPLLTKRRYLRAIHAIYGPQHYELETMLPAYEYGEKLRARDPNRDWTAVEADARAMWEKKNPGTWERFREAIRAAWHKG
jgi:hypothetical protein